MKNTCRHKRYLAPPLPNSFAGLMEMYEANYIRLRKLCGHKDSMPPIAVSCVAQGMDLYLQVLEQTRYTSTIALTYYFTDAHHGFLAYPDLKLRIYYDALQAEVISQSFKCKNRGWPKYTNSACSSLLTRWKMNRFLFKWLSFCNQQGHSFIVHDQSQQNFLLTEGIEVPLQSIPYSGNVLQ